MSEKIINSIISKAEALTQEETALLAGMLLAQFVSLDRDNCAAFLGQLSDSDREELRCRLEHMAE